MTNDGNPIWGRFGTPGMEQRHDYRHRVQQKGLY